MIRSVQSIRAVLTRKSKTFRKTSPKTFSKIQIRMYRWCTDIPSVPAKPKTSVLFDRSFQFIIVLNNSLTIVNFQRRLCNFALYTINCTPTRCEEKLPKPPCICVRVRQYWSIRYLCNVSNSFFSQFQVLSTKNFSSFYCYMIICLSFLWNMILPINFQCFFNTKYIIGGSKIPSKRRIIQWRG